MFRRSMIPCPAARRRPSAVKTSASTPACAASLNVNVLSVPALSVKVRIENGWAVEASMRSAMRVQPLRRKCRTALVRSTSVTTPKEE